MTGENNGNVVRIDSKRKKRFSDFADEPEMLDGEKIQISQILNKEIEVVGYRIRQSKYGKNASGQCLTLQFVDDSGERRVVFTGSDVLIDQMKKYGDQIPFATTIKKIDKYYTLS
jgi:hypothetical protein